MAVQSLLWKALGEATGTVSPRTALRSRGESHPVRRLSDFQKIIHGFRSHQSTGSGVDNTEQVSCRGAEGTVPPVASRGHRQRRSEGDTQLFPPVPLLECGLVFCSRSCRQRARGPRQEGHLSRKSTPCVPGCCRGLVMQVSRTERGDPAPLSPPVAPVALAGGSSLPTSSEMGLRHVAWTQQRALQP